MDNLSMVDDRGYCVDCDSYSCLHAQLYDALAEVEHWKRKATERIVKVRKAPQSDTGAFIPRTTDHQA